MVAVLGTDGYCVYGLSSAVEIEAMVKKMATGNNENIANEEVMRCNYNAGVRPIYKRRIHVVVQKLEPDT